MLPEFLRPRNPVCLVNGSLTRKRFGAQLRRHVANGLLKLMGLMFPSPVMFAQADILHALPVA